MEIVKIIGIGLVAVIFIVILKQYRPEFAIYASILARHNYDSNYYGQAYRNYKYV